MDWFLYDIGLRHERVNNDNFDFHLTITFLKLCELENQEILLKKTKTKKSKANKQKTEQKAYSTLSQETLQSKNC